MHHLTTLLEEEEEEEVHHQVKAEDGEQDHYAQPLVILRRDTLEVIVPLPQKQNDLLKSLDRLERLIITLPSEESVLLLEDALLTTYISITEVHGIQELHLHRHLVHHEKILHEAEEEDEVELTQTVLN